jgi:squalene monooxygenase
VGVDWSAHSPTHPRTAAAPWSELDDAIARFQARRSSHAATINVLANALHRVFTKPAGDNGTRDRLRAACVDYLSLGGASSAGPVGLLSGLTPKPGILVTHFFAVALHAMRRSLTPCPTPARLRQGYDLLRVACVIIMPLLAGERVTVLSWRWVQAAVDAVFPWRAVDPATL